MEEIQNKVSRIVLSEGNIYEVPWEVLAHCLDALDIISDAGKMARTENKRFGVKHTFRNEAGELVCELQE